MTEMTDMAVIRSQVDAALAEFLERKACEAAADGFPGEIIEVLRDFVFAGGKRLRPLLCVVGWHAAGGQDLPGSVVRVAACLEMFHAFTLIHDDIMDSSHTRRGAPTVHRALAARYAARSDAAQLGVNMAILIGDLALAWSDEILHTAGLISARLAHVLPVVDRMRTEVTRGQYLDLLATGQPGPDTDRALDIARYKTAKYTVERPLHIGDALAGAGAAALDALSAYALPTGEAFQLRDDLLGTFGTVTTGKSRVDDLRDGKHTILITLALRNATAPQRQALHALLGDPHLDEEGADRVRHLITTTGARDEAEAMIRTRHARALHALEQAALPPVATAALRYLADAAIVRNA
ncbi:polyprenyl synthetase family protein [Streptomyces sp. NPDC002886]|uniref:polyprenyl synthetase family protein n=1 Tax=Streptomyces sp. NPDC002886 TaxID=3364667 RepID=UPI00367642F9